MSLRLTAPCLRALILTILLPSILGFRPVPFLKGSESTHSRVPKVGIQVLRPSMQSASAAAMSSRSKLISGLHVDAKSGALRLILPAAQAVPPLDPQASLSAYEAKAMDFLKRLGRGLGVSLAQLKLDRSALIKNDQEVFLKYKVMAGSRWVQDASVDVRFKRGRLVQVINQSFGEAVIDEGATQSHLHLVIESKLPGEVLEHRSSLIRIRESKHGYEQVRVLEYLVAMGQDRYLVQVEETSGEIFEIAPTKLHTQGQVRAELFPRLWVDELESTPVAGVLVKQGARQHITDQNGAFTGTLGMRPRMEGYSGPLLQVETKSGSKVNITGNQNPNNGHWELLQEKNGAAQNHEDKDLAQPMVYHHTMAMIAQAKKYIDVPWLDQQLRANVNLVSSCNAHWDRIDRTINFYSAGSDSGMDCSNTALLADVVYHEWGHGLDDNTGGIVDGAYSEGFGDICSLIMTQSPVLAPYFTLDGGHVRELETRKVYPRDAGGGVHAEGQIIGSTFYQLFLKFESKFGRDRAVDLISNFAFKSIIAAQRYTEVYDALLVMDDDDGDLSNGTPHFCMINQVFAEHGLATASEACLIGRVESFVLDDRNGNGNGIVDPGEIVDVYVPLTNLSFADLSGVEATVQSNIDPAIAMLHDTNLSWNPLRVGQKETSEDPFKVEVDAAAECGTVIPLAFNITHLGKEVDQQRSLRIGKHVGRVQTYTAVGLPITIPDRSSAEAKQMVDGPEWSQTEKISALNLKVEITHTYIGDLEIHLTGPSGKSLMVYQGRGTGRDLSLALDLSHEFADDLGKGEWNLKVIDRFAGDKGQIESFELEIVPSEYKCDPIP